MPRTVPKRAATVAAPGPDPSDLDDFASFDGKLYFDARGRSGNDAELWRSNGTTAGTKLVKEFFPGLEGGFPKSLTRIGDTLYLSARDDVFGAEPWTLVKGR
jgi:ELWxxDGT repeat protein